VPEALQSDLDTEMRGRATIVTAIAACEEAKDFVSRDMLTEIQVDTEEHIDFLETELHVLSSVGLQNYLQSQAGSTEADEE